MSLTRESSWAIVAFVAFACGGKTGILEDFEPGGSASGGSAQGTGGSSGNSGAAGRGGSGGGTVGAGGFSGVGIGGAGGPPGGTGGAVVGGGDGTGGAVVGGAGGIGGSGEEVIEAICGHYEANGCARAAGCRDTYKGGFNTAEGSGCGDEWLTIYSCVLNDPTPCDAPLGCDEGFPIHQKCVEEALPCARSTDTTSGRCIMLCYAWSADCTKSNAGLHCTCTRGPRVGTRFDTSAACQSYEWDKTLTGACE